MLNCLFTLCTMDSSHRPTKFFLAVYGAPVFVLLRFTCSCVHLFRNREDRSCTRLRHRPTAGDRLRYGGLSRCKVRPPPSIPHDFSSHPCVCGSVCSRHTYLRGAPWWICADGSPFLRGCLVSSPLAQNTCTLVDECARAGNSPGPCLSVAALVAAGLVHAPTTRSADGSLRAALGRSACSRVRFRHVHRSIYPADR